MAITVMDEKAALQPFEQTLEAMTATKDPEELAHLITLAALQLSDAWCACKEKETVYGEGAETSTCRVEAGRASNKLLNTLREILGGK